MKSIVTLLILLSFVSCKKTASKTASPASTSNTNPTPTNTYTMSFTDGSPKTYTLSPTIQLAPSLYPAHANTEYGTWISIPGNSNNSGYFYIALPMDSSDVTKIQINTAYPIQYHTSYIAQTIPDSDLGSLSFLMSTPAGTDSTASNPQTSTFYHKVTAVQYIGRKYDQLNAVNTAQYVVTGVFNAQVKNDVTQQSRVFSNGAYKVLIACRIQ